MTVATALITVEDVLKRLGEVARGNVVTVTAVDIYRLLTGDAEGYPPPYIATAIYVAVKALADGCILREEVKLVKRNSRRHVLWLSVPCLRSLPAGGYF